MTTYEVVARGVDDVQRKLLRYGGQLDNWITFWPMVTEAFTRREEIWFEREGEGTWPPLSAKYAAWKAIAYPGKPILVREGNLKASLTDPSRAVLAALPHELFLGSDDRVAGYHRGGGPHLPKRDPLLPVIRLAGAIANLVQRHILWPPGFR